MVSDVSKGFRGNSNRHALNSHRIDNTKSFAMTDELKIKTALDRGSVDCYPCDPEQSPGFESTDMVLVEMTPDDFLALSAKLNERGDKRLFNVFLDEKQRPLYLFINLDDKQIDGHEGRHRAWASREQGIDRIPVLLVNRRQWYKYYDKDYPGASVDVLKELGICTNSVCTIKNQDGNRAVTFDFSKRSTDIRKTCREWCKPKRRKKK